MQARYKAEKRKVFEHYGLACACCGEVEYEFLQVDHMNGGGRQHLKSLKVRTMYTWLIAHGFPPEYQTLCANCNHAKGRLGTCPHQKGRE